MIGAVDFADAQSRLALGTWHAHFPLVVDTVGGIRLVFMRERVAVSGGLTYRGVTGEEPESAVVLIPCHRTLLAELSVERQFVEVELVGMMIEVHHRVGVDVGTCTHRNPPTRGVCEINLSEGSAVAKLTVYYLIFASLGFRGAWISWHVPIGERLEWPVTKPFSIT